MTIRPLTDIAEFQGCVALQREAWGSADIDIRPVTLFVTQSHIGGLVLGAFDQDRLVAFINATPGIRNGRPYWHSQMMAVSKDYWNSGIGSQLKLAQRNYARRRGLRLIEWTYDPLESKNAYLNITKLGAIVRRYYVNLYGEITSRLQQGLESSAASEHRRRHPARAHTSRYPGAQKTKSRLRKGRPTASSGGISEELPRRLFCRRL